MNNSSTTDQKPKNVSLLYVVIALVIIILGAGILYARHHKASSNPNNSSVGEWVEYNATNYGFKFEYLKSWGVPTVSKNAKGTGVPADATHPAPTNEGYVINFSNPLNGKKSSLLISFTPDTPIQIACSSADTNCPTEAILSSNSIKATLSQKNASFLTTTNNSYSIFNYSPINNGSSSLIINQIINLPKLNVSAASLSYTLANAASCPRKQLAPDSMNDCISETDYSNLSKSVASIAAL